MSKKAIFGGSFNPFHLGHMNILEKASRVFDEIYLVVAQNADKPKQHTSVETIRKDLKSWTIEGVKVVELPANQLLVDFAEEHGINFFVRGLRGVKDAMAELEMADINNSLTYMDLETVFFVSDPMYRHVSSSLNRSLVGTQGWEVRLEDYLPEHTEREFIEDNVAFVSLDRIKS